MQKRTPKNTPITVLWVNSDLPIPINSGCKKYTADLLARIQHFFKIFLLPLSNPQQIDLCETLSEVTLLPASRDKEPNSTISKLNSLLLRKTSIQSQFESNIHESDILEAIEKLRPSVIIFNHIRSALNIPRLQIRTIPTVYIAHNAETFTSISISKTSRGLSKLYFLHDAKKLAHLERLIIKSSSATITLTNEDKNRLNELCNHKTNITAIAPAIQTSSNIIPRNQQRSKLIITGSFLWKPKKENLRWFLEEVFKPLKQRFNLLEMHIIGKGADVFTKQRRPIEGVFTFDNVRDIYTHYKKDMIFIVPERQGGGIKIKTIEAASMGMPIVSTIEGIEGCHLEHNRSCLVAQSVAEFIANISELVENQAKSEALAAAARGAYETHLCPSKNAIAFRDHILDLCSTS